jgi:hypothetical protein
MQPKTIKSKNNGCIFENGRRPNFFLKGRLLPFFEYGRRPQKNNATKNN